MERWEQGRARTSHHLEFFIKSITRGPKLVGLLMRSVPSWPIELNEVGEELG